MRTGDLKGAKKEAPDKGRISMSSDQEQTSDSSVIHPDETKGG